MAFKISGGLSIGSKNVIDGQGNLINTRVIGPLTIGTKPNNEIIDEELVEAVGLGELLTEIKPVKNQLDE